MYENYLTSNLFLKHGILCDLWLKHFSILYCTVSYNNITFFNVQCSQWITGLILQPQKKKKERRKQACFGTTRKLGKNVQNWSMIKVNHFLPSLLSPLISLSWHCLWYLYLPRNNKSSLFPSPKKLLCYVDIFTLEESHTALNRCCKLVHSC